MKQLLLFLFLICFLPATGQSLQEKTIVEDGCRVQYRIADSLFQAGMIAQSMSHFRWIIGKEDEMENAGLVSDAFTGLGKTYEFTGKHDSAFAMYMESYKRVSESADTLRQARGLRDMAQLLRVLRQLDKARQYCSMALDLIPGIEDPKILANIYNEYAYLFELSAQLDSAAHYYQKLIDISIQNDFREGESVGYSNLASVYELEGRYPEALELKQRGLGIDLESGDLYGAMTSYVGISNTLLLMQQYRQALDKLKQAEVLCDTSWMMDLSGIEYGYYKAYKGMGSHLKALEHFEAYNRLNEIINKQESTKKVADLLTRYETEAKEQEIKLLEQTNYLKEQKIREQRLLITVMALLGLILIMLFLWWAHNKNEILKRMKTELQHFILSRGKENGLAENNTLQVSRPTSTSHNSPESEPETAYLKWGLTTRESEVIYYLGQGCSNAHIAEKLHVSTNTVKFHIKNIYLKLDVKNRIQALLRCSESKQQEGEKIIVGEK